MQVEKIDYRIILIDNGSIDNSVERLRQIFSKKIEYVALDKNYGFTGGNNIGIEYAQRNYNPDYFLLLNNDTIVEKSFLYYLVESFGLEDSIGIAVPKIYYYQQPEYIYYAGGYLNILSGFGEHYGKMKRENETTNVSREVTFANGCAMMIKKEVIEKVGMLDNMFFAVGEDAEYSYRVRKRGYKIYYSSRARIWHQEGHVSKKNKGEWFRVYLTTRNVILFKLKYWHILTIIPFIFYFAFRWIIYMSIKLFLKGDYKSIICIYEGIIDAIKKRNRYIE
jgi:hypothetical protein